MSEDYQSLLFLGVDLVGSTQYKQTFVGWPETFLTFYRQFPQVLDEKNTGKCQFNLWKAIGDELIFHVNVRREHDVLQATRIWLQAMDDYEGTLRKGDSGMLLKGGAFVATFPGPDSEATVPWTADTEASDGDPIASHQRALANRDTAAYLYDYFGPGIDTGFRVLGAATRNHFTLGLEVAWAMSEAAGTHPQDAQDIVYLGESSFKGVWRSRGYPLFAVDRNHGDAAQRAIRSLNPQNVSTTVIAEVGRSCSKDPDWATSIYLPDANRAEFKQKRARAVSPGKATTYTEGDGSDDKGALGVTEIKNPPLGDPLHRTEVQPS